MSSKAKILIISSQHDYTGETMYHALKKGEAVYFNVSQLETQPLALRVGMKNEILWSEGASYSLSKFRTVWIRRTYTAGTELETKNHFEKNIYTPARNDNFHPFRVALTHYRQNVHACVEELCNRFPSDARVVSPLFSMKKAECKLFQLDSAKKAGLFTPPTLLTNNGNEVLRFYTKLKKPKLIAKFYSGLALPYTKNKDKQLCLTTEPFGENKILALKGINLKIPRIFQPEIEGVDARITMFGSKLIGCYLKPKTPKYLGPDFRYYYEDMEYEAISAQMLNKLRPALIKFNRILGLRFGSMDFKVEERTGRFVFLETNPYGQYLWPETVLGTVKYPATQLTLDYLRHKIS